VRDSEEASESGRRRTGEKSREQGEEETENRQDPEDRRRERDKGERMRRGEFCGTNRTVSGMRERRRRRAGRMDCWCQA